MKGKCKYCHITLPDIANIRCDKCDVIWRDGVQVGEDIIRQDVREVFIRLQNIAGLTERRE